MKRLILKDEELYRYKLIKKVKEKTITKKEAAQKLNITIRTVNRLTKRYEELGKRAFVHGNKFKAPKHTIDEVLRNEILNLYKDKYRGNNFKYFHGKLITLEGYKVSESFVRCLLKDNGIEPPPRKKNKIDE